MTFRTAFALSGTFLFFLTASCDRHTLATPLPEERRIVVELRNFEFRPETIEVEKAELIGFELTSADIRHRFTVVGTNIDVDVQPGQTSVERIRFETPGTFTILCTIAGHAKAGMVGNLIVR